MIIQEAQNACYYECVLEKRKMRRIVILRTQCYASDNLLTGSIEIDVIIDASFILFIVERNNAGSHMIIMGHKFIYIGGLYITPDTLNVLNAYFSGSMCMHYCNAIT